MEEYFRLGGPNPKFYNCSKYSFDEWLQKGIKRPILALYLEISGAIFFLSYIVALCGMVRGRLFQKNSCYIIMFFMGLADLGSLQVSSTISGFLCWKGTVYCNYPNFVYISGSIGLGLWSMCCGFCILLATNRLSEVAEWHLVTKLFTRTTVTFFCLCSVTYGLFMTIMTPPPLFYSPLVAWFANPFNESGLIYRNLIHSINNGLVSILAIVAYLGICWKATKNWGKMGKRERMCKAQKLLYVQAFIICTTHVMAAWGYMLMNHIADFPPKLILIGHIAWQWSHGSPGVIYMLLNRTIRTNALEMIFRRPRHPSAISPNTSKTTKTTTPSILPLDAKIDVTL